MSDVGWGEYALGDLFEIRTSRKRFDANKVTILRSGGHPYVVRQDGNNGQRGFIIEDEQHLNPGNTIAFGQDTATVTYQPTAYFTGDKVKVLVPRFNGFSRATAPVFVAAIRRSFSNYSWGGSSFSAENLAKELIRVPSKDGAPAICAIIRLVAELEARHVAELETYLSSAGLHDCTLSEADHEALTAFASADWASFNLKELFGPATRGKRLKSTDRTPGDLPFVTAGETETGISAFIGNEVKVFPAGSFTIDMFGSAKFRNYDYGGDDHVAVVHTENLTRNAAIFVTGAAHKAAHTGAFDYGRNFYAKDADALDVSLPAKDGKPDWELMDAVIGATHKLVVRGVAEFAARETEATRRVTGLDARSSVQDS